MAAVLRRSHLVALLIAGASRPNPRRLFSSSPAPTSPPSATAGKPALDYGDLLSWIPRSGSAMDYVKRWAKEHSQNDPHPVLHQVVYELCNARRYKQAVEIIEFVKVNGTSQAEKYYEKLDNCAQVQTSDLLLRGYITERNVERAETFMAELLSCGLPVDPYSCNEMMKLYIATYQYEKVLSLIDLMKQDYIRRNVLSYNIWMNACAEVSGVASVQSVFEEMLNDDKVKVGWKTYCTLANIFRKYGENSKALDYLRTAETKLSSTGSLGYPFIMTCYAALNDRDGVMRLWKASESVPRRIPTANYMTAMIKVGDIVRADWIYGKWEAQCWKHQVRVSNLLKCGKHQGLRCITFAFEPLRYC